MGDLTWHAPVFYVSPMVKREEGRHVVYAIEEAPPYRYVAYVFEDDTPEVDGAERWQGVEGHASRRLERMPVALRL